MKVIDYDDLDAMERAELKDRVLRKRLPRISDGGADTAGRYAGRTIETIDTNLGGSSSRYYGS